MDKKKFFATFCANMTQSEPDVPQPGQPGEDDYYWWQKDTFEWDRSMLLDYEYKGEPALNSVIPPPLIVLTDEIVIRPPDNYHYLDFHFKFIIDYEFGQDPAKLGYWGNVQNPPINSVYEGAYMNESSYAFVHRKTATSGTVAIYGHEDTFYGGTPVLNQPAFSIFVPTGYDEEGKLTHKILNVCFYASYTQTDTVRGLQLCYTNNNTKETLPNVSIKFRGFAYKCRVHG